MITWQPLHFYGEKAMIGNTELTIVESGYKDNLVTRLYQDGQLVDWFKSIDAAKDYVFRMYGEC